MSAVRLFKDCGTVMSGFEWDGERWNVEYGVLTLGDRKDISRLCRVNPESEWPQLTLEFTLARAMRTVNGKTSKEETWNKELNSAPESLIDQLSNAYREARLFTVTPPGDPEFVELARQECDAYLEAAPKFLVEEDQDDVFSLLAPIPRFVWWAGEFYLVHFHVLTLEERRLIARFLGISPKDQAPHIEVQQTLARAIYAVNGVRADEGIGVALDERMEWVEEFPESLIAVLSGQYESAKNEPKGELYRMIADPK